MSGNHEPKKVIDLENEQYELQFRDEETGRWVTAPGPRITGHSAAFKMLDQVKADPEQAGVGWRTIRRDLAEAYRSGLNDATRSPTKVAQSTEGSG